MKLLNLGCGENVHPLWENIDLHADYAGVQAHDLRKGIPFDDRSCDVVYHSHMIEHLTAPQGVAFMKECWRVLAHDGVVRVVVPDLEALAYEYLDVVHQANEGVEGACFRHKWLVLELFDQVGRETGGGEMLDCLCSIDGADREYAFQRVGCRISQMALAEGERRRAQPKAVKREDIMSWFARCIWHLIMHPHDLREVVIKRLLGAEYQLLEIGRYRRCGEVHRCMYDRISLASCLRTAGFVDVIRRDHDTSRILNWRSFGLDSTPDGKPRKPGSLFMEARKP